MAKCYYVDSENVGDMWIDLMSDAEPDAQFLVFYTSRSPHIAYENAIKLLKFDNKPEFIHCCEGNNALDFQLVTCLGYMLCKNPNDEIFIVSRDAGFDAVINFWHERGITIRRIHNLALTDKAPTPEQHIPVASKNVAIAPLEDYSTKTIEGIAQAEIDNILSCIPIKNRKALLYHFLTHFYGIHTGLKIYKIVTASSYVSHQHKYSEAERFSVLCKYIIKYDTHNSTLPDGCEEFLFKHRTKYLKLPAIINSEYGTKAGQAINSVFKPYYNCLSKII